VQLKSAQAQLIDVSADRAQLEHAIRALVGKPPSDFSLASVEAEIALPATPQTVPSDLLGTASRHSGCRTTRRVRQCANRCRAQRLLSAAHVVGSGGYRNTVFAESVFSAQSHLVGGTRAGGNTYSTATRDARKVNAPMAAYDESVAQYRQTVLTGFQEVETIRGAGILADEAQIESEAWTWPANRSG